jgi:hypothetical protein
MGGSNILVRGLAWSVKAYIYKYTKHIDPKYKILCINAVDG